MKLTLRSKHVMRHPIARIEALLMDFAVWPEIFEKVQSIEPRGDSAEGIIRFKRKEMTFKVSVHAHQPLQSVEFRMQVNEERGLADAALRYSFVERSRGKVLVREELRYKEPVPFVLWLIANLFQVFGKSQGDAVLERVDQRLSRESGFSS